MSIYNCQRVCCECETPEPKVRAELLSRVSDACLVALLILGILGCCNVLLPAPLGWSAIGVATASLLFRFAGGLWQERKWELLNTSAIIAIQLVVGVLGVTGHLSSWQIGAGILFPFALSILICFCKSGKEFCQKKILNRS